MDASRAFGEQRTGTEEYSFQLLTHLLALDEAKEHLWILYIRPQFLISNSKFLNNYKNVQIINIPNKYLWTQGGLAYRTWVDKLDLLWVPAHTLPVLRRPGVTTVVTIHGIEYEWLPAYENALQRWYLPLSTKYAVLSAKKIIAVSEFTKKQLVERLGADEKKIKVIHEGVEKNGKLIMDNEKLILDKFNLQKRKFILFVGTVQPRKNLERLIQAFSYLTPDPSPSKGEGKLKLVICGKLGWNYERVVELAQKNGVVITGYISEAERDSLLRNALVYVQPSITEGFGLPVIEAMRAGVPVLSSNGGALAEIVGDAGILFDPLDIDDMSHKLSLVIDSHGLRNDLIRLGKKRVGEFSWQKAAEETYKYLTISYSK